MSITVSPIETALIIDSEGAALTEGMLVFFPATDEKPNGEYGVITSISDADGDVDDEGRAYGINPEVTVTFTDGEQVEYLTSDTRSGWWSDTQYQADELTAVSADDAAASDAYSPARA